MGEYLTSFSISTAITRISPSQAIAGDVDFPTLGPTPMAVTVCVLPVVHSNAEIIT